MAAKGKFNSHQVDHGMFMADGRSRGGGGGGRGGGFGIPMARPFTNRDRDGHDDYESSMSNAMSRKRLSMNPRAGEFKPTGIWE